MERFLELKTSRTELHLHAGWKIKVYELHSTHALKIKRIAYTFYRLRHAFRQLFRKKREYTGDVSTYDEFEIIP
ncbi:hypothetical protein KEJ15_08300 [Candidatus Bathyarchaeota archaeon]|nr:hypothetical protein [Candidatus Bathyarchaeota archaeon]